MESRPLLLLVDDDASIRRLCSRMLQRMGFRLLEAEDGTSARSQFASHAKSLQAVLLDVHLPDVTGKQLSVEFTSSHPELPVIFFTGSTQSEQETDADGRVQYYLKKPFTRKSLQTVLQNVGVVIPPSPTES